VNDLDVNDELIAVVAKNQDADAAAVLLEGSVQTGVEAGLVNDGKAGPNITGLSHGSDGAVLDVENAVLLEDRAKHGLDNDAGSGVGDEGGLLMELLGEQVNTEVAVLAGGGGGGDADDLAGTALEHQDITHADVVARDGDGVGRAAALAAGASGARGALLDVIATAALRVEDTVGHFVKTVAERVVVTLVVVVAHFRLLDGRCVRILTCLLGDFNVLLI
jgi:hypothetical protein